MIRGNALHRRFRALPAGFTLVEVLVVVAVLALLMAILLPSLARSRERARTVVCLSNMRQLGIAVHMFAHSHQGRFVSHGLETASVPNSEEREAESWFNTMNREYGNKLVARCPTDRSVYWTEPHPNSDPPAYRVVSYAFNDYLSGKVEGWESYNLLHRVRRPATTVVFVELAEDTGFAVGDHFHPQLWPFNARYEAGLQMALERHLGRANYTFADGHANTHRFEQTYELRGLRRVHGQFIPEWAHNMYDPKVGH